jgi:hypothetical protein
MGRFSGKNSTQPTCRIRKSVSKIDIKDSVKNIKKIMLQVILALAFGHRQIKSKDCLHHYLSEVFNDGRKKNTFIDLLGSTGIFFQNVIIVSVEGLSSNLALLLEGVTMGNF